MSDGRERDVKRSRDSYKVDSRHYDNPESMLRSTCQFSQTGEPEGKEAWKPRKHILFTDEATSRFDIQREKTYNA